MPIGIDMNNYDISMGTGQIRMSGGGTFTSDNSINYDWISRASPADYIWFGITYGAGLFVAMGYNGSDKSVATSPDGINWTLRTTPGSGWRSVVYGNGVFVAVGDGGANKIMTSTDGISWTAINQFTTTGYLYVAYGLVNGTTPTFVAVGHNGTNNRIIYSTNNGVTWTGITTYDVAFYSCAFGNGRFVALSADAPYALYSSNGISWTQTTVFQVGHDWNAVTYANGLFVAVSGSLGSGTGGQNLISRVATSPDGITWTNRYSPDNIALLGVAGGAGIFVAVGTGVGNRTITSTDGITWTLRPSANDSVNWRQVCYGNGIFVATAHSGGTGNRVMTLDPASGMSINKITTEETTTNLVKFGQNGATISANPSKNFAWVSRTAVENNGWHAVCYGNSLFVAVAFSGTNRVMTSSDGYNWVARTPPANNWLNVCYGELSGNNVYVAVGHTGTNRSMYSTDGTSWTAYPTPNDASMEWGGICFGYDTSGNGRFVGTAINGTAGLPRVMTSSNGINWTPQNASNNALAWRGVCYGYDSSGQGQFVAVAQDGTGNRSMYSINGGVTWVGKPTTDDNTTWYSVCYGNGTFVAVAAYTGAIRKRVMYSRHIIGAGWSEANYPVENDWWGVAFGNGLFVATAVSGVGNRVMTSPDGINWTIRASVADNIWKGICYGNGTFVAVSTSGTNRVMTNDYTANDNMLVLNGGLTTPASITTTDSGTISGKIVGVNVPSGYNCPNGSGANTWCKIGVFTAPQTGQICIIKVYGSAGYNANPSQSYILNIFFKTSNGTSIDPNGFAGDCYFTLEGDTSSLTLAYPYPIWIANAGGVSATNYTLYIFFRAYGNGNFYTAEVSQSGVASWKDAYTFNSTPPSTTGSATCLVSSLSYNVENQLGYTYTPTITWVGASANYSVIGTSVSLSAGVYTAYVGINFNGTFGANNYIYPSGGNVGDIRFPIIQNAGNGQVAIASGSYAFRLSSAQTVSLLVINSNSLTITTYIWTITRIA